MIGFPKPRSRVFDKLDAKAEAAALKKDVYAEVDYRDKRRCRCCGRRGNPNASTVLEKLHRAHIQDASCGGELAAWNLVSLCARCHVLEHAKQLHFVGTDANDFCLGFEFDEAAVVHVFAHRTLPAHVRIITASRRGARGGGGQ